MINAVRKMLQNVLSKANLGSIFRSIICIITRFISCCRYYASYYAVQNIKFPIFNAYQISIVSK